MVLAYQGQIVLIVMTDITLVPLVQKGKSARLGGYLLLCRRRSELKGVPQKGFIL
jgi:hypothetical protein